MGAVVDTVLSVELSVELSEDDVDPAEVEDVDPAEVALDEVDDVFADVTAVVDVVPTDVLELSVSVVSSNGDRVVLPPSMVVSSGATVHVVVVVDVVVSGSMITPPE